MSLFPIYADLSTKVNLSDTFFRVSRLVLLASYENRSSIGKRETVTFYTVTSPSLIHAYLLLPLEESNLTFL